VKRDGPGLQQLTFNTATDEYPSYSPDGKRIACYTDQDGNYEVYKRRASDGSNPTNLTNKLALGYQPIWRPK
jgi:Tol biopolymer transport system component